MTQVTRRGLICAASAGAACPLVVGESATAAGAAVIATSEVPVGGGVVVAGRGVVVTQPRKGRFQVFSATCTHEGCTVSRVADRRIGCPCHGSQYSITDGSVVRGPAEAALPRRTFKIKRGKIYLT